MGFGHCVYNSDNDVADHQSVHLEFSNSATAVFEMVAFTEEPGRETRVFGTKGELRCRSTEEVEHVDFLTKQTTLYRAPVLEENRDYTGHGSSSFYMLEAFVSALRQHDPSLLLSG